MMNKLNANKLVETIKIFTEENVEVHDVQKGNVILTGISIGNGVIRPVMYTKDFEDLFNTSGYLAVAMKMIKIAEKAKENSLGNPNDFTSWDYAKEHLKLCIAPKGNRDIVVYPYLDLEMYVRVIVKSENDTTASYKVQNKRLEAWNITREQLFKTALDCTKPTYKVQSMSELLFGFEDDTFPMMVAKTEDDMNGASVIYCKDILKEIADKFDSDLLIIPSSIHEILLQPIGNFEFEGIDGLINNVNTENLEPEEVLSDHAYIFHKDTSEITW